jgi:lipid A 3-O-deacylase
MTPARNLAALLPLLAPWLFAGTGHGEETPQTPPVSVSIIVENDMFAGTDRHYTNGVRASWMRPEGVMPAYGTWLADSLLGPANGAKRRIGYAFGQSMITPGDIETRTLLRDDRPYAGWLYGEVILTSEKPPSRTSPGQLDTLALSLGVVGPASLAETTQRQWHENFGLQDPKGWDNQIENEPAINLTLYRQWPYLRWLKTGAWGADITPHVGAALGNVFTHAAMGANLRFGRNLENDFGGPPRIGPAPPGVAYVAPVPDFAWYAFAGFELRAVARNIFLDGNTFRSSHHVDKKVLVGDAQLGVAMLWNGYRLTYTQVFRSREFFAQDRGDRFGAITLTVPF